MAPAFSKLNFEYSTKNIPLATQKQIKLQLLHSVDKTTRTMDWKAHFTLHPNEKESKNNYGFKSIRAAPEVPEMMMFKKRLASEVVENLEFRKFGNEFQNKMKEDLNNVTLDTKLLISADKTSNTYLMSMEGYNQKRS